MGKKVRNPVDPGQESPGRLRIPVEKITELTFPDRNPIEFEEGKENENDIEVISGKNKFEMIFKTGDLPIGNITMEINDENKIEIYNGGKLIKVTPEIPRLCDFNSITSRYNPETRILSITGNVRERTIRVQRP